MSVFTSKCHICDCTAKENISEDKARREKTTGKNTKEEKTTGKNTKEEKVRGPIEILLCRMLNKIDIHLENYGIVEKNMEELNEYIQELKLFISIPGNESHIMFDDPDLYEYIQNKFKMYIIKGIDIIDLYENLFPHDDSMTGYEIKKTIGLHISNSTEDSVGDSDSNYLEQPELPPISQEDMININKWVENNCRWNMIKKLNSGEVKIVKKIPNEWKVGQIVGARDNERNWWMARILYVFNDPKYSYPWYYVHFEGWNDIHNEWISTPYRIRKFLPKRDMLKF